MDHQPPENMMLSEAMAQLAATEKFCRQLFLLTSLQDGQPCWEPPVDLLETDGDLLVYVVLPGAKADEIDVRIRNGELIIRGRREPPPELCHATVIRLELPFGRFERRIPIPPGTYAVKRQTVRGYLLIRLSKSGEGETA